MASSKQREAGRDLSFLYMRKGGPTKERVWWFVWTLCIWLQRSFPRGTVILMDLYFSHWGAGEEKGNFVWNSNFGKIQKLSTWKQNITGVPVGFAVGYVWVRLLNYLLSLCPGWSLHLTNPLWCELHALTVILKTHDTPSSTQCLGFFTPRSHGGASSYLFDATNEL